MEKALQVVEGRQLVNIEDYAMTVDSLIGQVALIQKVMERVMKVDEHYGTIPGTNKPTLLKPGAEKLCLTFRLDPDYDIIREVREKDFIAYTVKCDLKHIPTGQAVASGIGSCNSRETKYRYRSQSTGQPVPKAYWDSRDSALLGGSQYMPRKKDGGWIIFEQIENDNPWDLDNTLIKMACKRALVAATLNATAASDIFTQDVEDMPSELIGGSDRPKNTAQQQAKKYPPKDDQEQYQPKDPDSKATQAQVKRIFAIGYGSEKKHGVKVDGAMITKLMDFYKGGSEHLTKAQASALGDDLEADPAAVLERYGNGVDLAEPQTEEDYEEDYYQEQK